MVVKKSEHRKEWENEYHARLEVHEKYIGVYYPRYYRKKLMEAIRHRGYCRFNFTQDELKAFILGGKELDKELQRRGIIMGV